MPFPRKPYIMRVEKVTDGADVASATLKFENVTKSLHKEITGTATNSNGSYDLGGVGDWDNGDEIKVTATKGVETGFETHTIVESTDHGRHNFGIVTISSARTTKLSRSTMNVHAGVMFQTLTGGHGY